MLSEINQVEMILMKDLYKTAHESKLKAPLFNSTDTPPAQPNYEDIKKGTFPDENIWLWDA